MDKTALLGFFGVVFTALCAVVSNIIVSHNATRELYAKLDKQSELSDAKIEAEIGVIDTRLNLLTEEVHKHNNFGERITHLEADVESIKRQTW